MLSAFPPPETPMYEFAAPLAVKVAVAEFMLKLNIP